MHSSGEAFIEGSRTLMTVRTTSKTVTFTHPFNLSGMDKAQPAGTYTVETDEELLQTLSLPAYRRISTLVRDPNGAQSQWLGHRRKPNKARRTDKPGHCTA